MMSASLLMPKTSPTIPVPSGVSNVATPASAAQTRSGRARVRSHTNAVTSTAATTTPPTTTAPWRFAQRRNTTGSHANRPRASSVTVTTSNNRLNTWGRNDATIRVTGRVRNTRAPRRSTGPTMSRQTSAKVAVATHATRSASAGMPPIRCSG